MPIISMKQKKSYQIFISRIHFYRLFYFRCSQIWIAEWFRGRSFKLVFLFFSPQLLRRGFWLKWGN